VPALVHVDAFTDRPFAGNPAAVVLLPGPADAAWMQAVADELQLPATAFVAPLADGFQLRWFTATSELALCGHGTLASAHVLFERQHFGGAAVSADAKRKREMSTVKSFHCAVAFVCVFRIKATPCGAPSALMHFPILLRTNTFESLIFSLDAPAVHSIRMHGEYFGPTVKGQPITR